PHPRLHSFPTRRSSDLVRDHDAFIGPREVMHQFSAFAVIEHGAERNFQNNIFALSAGPVGAFTVCAASGLVFWIEAKMDKRVVTDRKSTRLNSSHRTIS